MILFPRIGLKGVSRSLLSSSTRIGFASTFASSATPRTSRYAKYARRVTIASASAGTIWLADRQFNESALTRNLRTLSTCAAIALDYKLNFSEATSDRIPELHARVADRVYNLLTTNGGLYIKIGQAIGAQAALLPPPMQAKFARLFDDAPQVPYETVAKVFTREFGGRQPDGPGGVFAEFERDAIASASVAQVHRARLWPQTDDPHEPPQWVAVKIQKPSVSKQVEWDLAAFGAVMWVYEHWLFHLPVTFMTDFISDHLREELNFIQEARNAEATASFVQKEPSLRDRVYIPKVYPEYSTSKVMTAEWIDGVRLSNKAAIRQLMREHDAPQQGPVTLHSPLGTRSVGPLKGGVNTVMQSMVDLFCAQIFDWGWVHCDPHPGNILVRPHPLRPKEPQIVLLDHGLYVRLREDFRRQYAVLWRGLLTLDQEAIASVAQEWGFGAPDVFASATLMRPVRFKKPKQQQDEGQREEQLSNYELGQRMKQKMRDFLSNTDLMPKELVFIGRNMRIMQGNNQSFGSPVNRIKTMGAWASRGLTKTNDHSPSGLLKEYWLYARFRMAMFLLDVVFWGTYVRGWMQTRLGQKREGFEDAIERRMRGLAKENLGYELGPGAFEG